ncbi:KpsF/GutQ family sugar-phosphate isomerase [bacterium D16-51]|nr:KpsF/GutQ family sugar-phosphate isomerase [bacterium D16-59]RKI59580.1 KpsF/GutQ family sugar-phosphate isomerase [bacterium D16-51]
MNQHVRMGKEVFEKEIEVLSSVKNQLNDTFDKMLQEIMNCKGKVIFIGMGKSGHVAKKIAASMASLGTCSVCMHPGECMHGDLGMIQKQDVVVLISYSGESDEIVRIIPSINIIGATILGITSNGDSTLAKSCKVVQVMENVKEACHLGLAPTSSTTAVMVYGDALSVVASRLKGFGKDDFGVFHPAGSLGKKLITRSVDLMRAFKTETFVKENATILQAIEAMINTDTDMIAVVNDEDKLIGIVTNGDLKKYMPGKDINKETIQNLVHYYPVFVDISSMAIEALQIMEDKHVHAVPVVNEDKPVGVIERREILKYGIYL